MSPRSNGLVWAFPDWEPPKRAALPCAGVCTRLSVCKQPAQLKGLAPPLPAPGYVPPLPLLPLPLSVSQQLCSSLLSVLVPCQALTWDSPHVSGTSPCHPPGGGDLCGGRLTPLSTLQADVSRGLCSSLTFLGILCRCAGPGENNHVHIASRTVTEVLGLSQRSWNCHRGAVVITLS